MTHSRPVHRPRVYSYSSGPYYYGHESSSASSVKSAPLTKRQKQINGYIIGIVIVSFFLFFFSVLFGGNIGSANLIKNDAHEYYEIIERAENGEEGYYLIEIENIRLVGQSQIFFDKVYELEGNHNAYFTAYCEERSNGVDYFYYEFGFVDGEGRIIEGESYTCYSEAAVKGLSSMTFAYTKEYDGDGSWDVIDVNYSLQDNKDYWHYQNPVIVGSVFGSVCLLLDGFFIYMLIKKVKEKETVVKPEENPVEKKVRTCAYCGSSVDGDAKKCSACGARDIIEK